MSRLVLVSLIGKETILNYRIYTEFEPDLVVHLYSDHTKGEEEILNSLISETTKIIPILVNGHDYNQVVEALINKLEVTTTDYITVNLTGGTKMMALATYAFVQQSLTNIKKEFCYVGLDQTIYWFERGERDSFTKSLSLEEFITLSGQKILNYAKYSDEMARLKPAFNQIKKIHKSSLWTAFLKAVLKEIRHLKSLRENRGVSSKELVKRYAHLWERSEFSLDWRSGHLEISYSGSSFLDLELSESDIEGLLFNSGWFELLVAQRYAKHYDPRQLFLNVKFPVLADLEHEKNEVDLIINDGNKLIFVECKSGQVTTDNINTINARKETYGGLISQSILVTKYDLQKYPNAKSKLIVEKCKDLDIKHIPYFKI